MLSVLAVPVLLAIPVTTLPSPKAHPVKPSEQLVTLGSFDRPAAGVLASAKQGIVGSVPTLSVREEATHSYSAVAVTWAADKGLGPVTAQVRGKQGSRWTEWHTAEADDQSPPARGEKRLGSELVWLGPSQGVDVSVTSASGRSPRDVAVRLIDPGTSAADASPGGRQPRAKANADPTRPTIYARDQWGADESIMTWPPEYNSTIKAGFLHHTVQATSYTPAQVPAMIRADYQYHAVGRGWGDIGY
ncbi:MAG: hypothetical protein DLM59_04415, partial [Pseudonocardiales bacterium]